MKNIQKGEFDEVGNEIKEFCKVSGKICYSKKRANAVLRFAKFSRSKKIPKRVYYCEYCHTYHLTHSKYGMLKKDVFYKKEMY